MKNTEIKNASQQKKNVEKSSNDILLTYSDKKVYSDTKSNNNNNSSYKNLSIYADNKSDSKFNQLSNSKNNYSNSNYDKLYLKNDFSIAILNNNYNQLDPKDFKNDNFSHLFSNLNKKYPSPEIHPTPATKEYNISNSKYTYNLNSIDLNKKNSTNDLKKPLLLSGLANNTKNPFNYDNLNFNPSLPNNFFQIKSPNEKTSENNIFNYINNPKISNAFLIDYENNFVNCNNICTNTCTRSNFMNMLKIDNEEIFEKNINNNYNTNSRKNPNEFNISSKSILILLCTVFFAAFHIGLYRKLYNVSEFLYKDKFINLEQNKNIKSNQNHFFDLSIKDFIFEINLFTWRYQMISVFLLIYIFLANFLIKKNYIESLEGRLSVLGEIKGRDFFKEKNRERNLHLMHLSLNVIFTIENMKNMGIICFSAFLLFFSTLFIPISMTLAIQYLTILLKMFFSMDLNFEIKTNKLFRLIIYIFTLLGIMMSLSNNFYPNSKFILDPVHDNRLFQQDLINKTSSENGILNNTSKYLENPNNTISIPNKKNISSDDINVHENKNEENTKIKSSLVNLIGISFSILSGLINIYFCDGINNLYLSSYSAIEYIVISNFNSALIMTFLNFILNAYFANPFYSVSWFIQYNNSLNLSILLLGLVGFLNIMFTIFSAVYLNSYYLKFVKLLEIPLADTIAIYFLSVYKFTNEINYHIGLLNFLIVIVLIEFSDFFLNKRKNNKYNF